MKKILLILICAGFTAGFSFAQTADLVDPMYVADGELTEPEDEELDVHWDVVNSSDQEMTFRARRIVGEEVEGSENRFCWGPICYGSETDESSTTDALLVVLGPGETETTFSGYYNHNGNAGCTEVTYCFFDHNNVTDETCHSVTFAVDCEVSVHDVAALEGTLSQISPNPLRGVGSFSYQMSSKSSNSYVVVYNMVGETIKEINLNNPAGLVYINADEFESGVYFYSLVSNNEVLSTKKMIIGG